jgi:predicted nucleotidyltransferase
MSEPTLKSLERPPVDEALIQEVVRKIVTAFNPHRIILFGSRARGDQRGDSDIDLFVEMETDLHPIKRRTQIRELFERQWWGMDLIVKTPDEVRRERDSLISLVSDIESEGKVLYERSDD